MFLTATKIKFYDDMQYNTNKPNCTMLKIKNASKLYNSNSKHKVDLQEELKLMYDWYFEEC